jgi:hypothetical protein
MLREPGKDLGTVPRTTALRSGLPFKGESSDAGNLAHDRTTCRQVLIMAKVQGCNVGALANRSLHVV